MTVINPEKIAEIIIECAEKYILPRYKLLEDHEIQTKSGPNDLVTQADLDVEAHLTRILPDLLPGSVVIGEESASENPDMLNILQDDTQKLWIVDPVDGTGNFVRHEREFGVMLACIMNGETQLSWIYDVLGKEIAITERGSGAFIGSTRLQVDPEVDLGKLSGYINPKYFPKNIQDEIKEIMQSFDRCKSLNCAAHEYLHLAKGETHFSIYSRLKACDHLPGVFMAAEAGAYIAKWDGNPYTPKDHHTGLISASNQDVWDHVFNQFLKNRI